jgi:hypothetical protein
MPYQKEMKMLLLAAITNDGSANGKISRVPKIGSGLGNQPKDGKEGERMLKRLKREKKRKRGDKTLLSLRNQ